MLEGVHNFREIAGYRAADGRRLRGGMLFRSSIFAEATEQDFEKLDGLGIRWVCDLRSAHERARRVIGWPRGETPELWHGKQQQSVGSLVDVIVAPDARTEHVVERMLQTYRVLPYEQADAYATILRRVAAGDVPLVIHCFAGKDRTGVGVALLLDLIGIPRDAIIEDYERTERAIERLATQMLTGPVGARLEAAGRPLWEVIMRADRLYIETMFEEVEQRHGSVESFAREELGFFDMDNLKNSLLASHS